MMFEETKCNTLPSLFRGLPVDPGEDLRSFSWPMFFSDLVREWMGKVGTNGWEPGN